MRTEQKREKLVSNRIDSTVSVDERQIKESRGGWQSSPWARTPKMAIWYQKEGQILTYIFENVVFSSLFWC